MYSSEERIGPITMIRFERPIDRDHAPIVEDWADEKLKSGDRFLVVHCGKVTYFDSVGLETLLAITRSAASQGARFALVQLNQDCSTTIRVTRLENAIEHYLTTEDAVRALRGVMS